MELCDGSLQHLIEDRFVSRKPFPEKEILRIFFSVCLAVEFLHTRNPPIIHRDLKVINFTLIPKG
jgi:serine/threonine protein kinase